MTAYEVWVFRKQCTFAGALSVHGKLLPQLLRHDWILNYFHLNASCRVRHNAVLSVLGFCLQAVHRDFSAAARLPQSTDNTHLISDFLQLAVKITQT